MHDAVSVLYTELNHYLEHHLSDGLHSSKPTDLMRLHLEHTFVGAINNCIQAISFATSSEYICNWSQQCCIQDKNLVHKQHVNGENWRN